MARLSFTGWIVVFEENYMTNFYAQLPRKRMAAAALILDEQGNLLIVKPTYRPDWLLPGGTVEENESPRLACIREAEEEVGIRVTVSRLLCVDYTAPDGEKTEALHFAFDAGTLNADQIAAIRLPPHELSEYRFAPLAEALALLNPKLAKRIPHMLNARKTRTTVYLEEGVPQWSGQ
jgi:8-oxo-dGTP pyrophosphatase MutT (NUDIX family)